MDATPFVDKHNTIDPADPAALTRDELLDVVDSVRDSNFLGCDGGSTIEDCMIDFCDGMTPEWCAFQDPDGTCYVNCAGIADLDGEDIEIALQFEMSSDLKSFSLYAMTIEGEPQTDKFMDEFQLAFGG